MNQYADPNKFDTKGELFQCGLICTKRLSDGDYGYVNEKGELVIDFTFDDAYAFDPTEKTARVFLTEANTCYPNVLRGWRKINIKGDFVE